MFICFAYLTYLLLKNKYWNQGDQNQGDKNQGDQKSIKDQGAQGSRRSRIYVLEQSMAQATY